MTHADPHIAPPNAAPNAYPPLQAEDYLPILRGLSMIAWIMLAGMVALEVWVRSSATLTWPHMGGFALGYRLITVEFALATLMFSLLITHRAWFERAPREASAKLHHLLWVMLIWLTLHFFGLLHVSGGLSSPLLLLLPIAIIAAYLSLPPRTAAAMAGGLVAGLVLLAVLTATPVIGGDGALSHVFKASGAPSPAAPVILLLAVLFAIGLGRAVRTQFQAHNLALHRPPLCDPLTHLYTRETLRHRLATELVRAHRQNDPTAVLMLEVSNLGAIVATYGFDTSARVLRQLADALAGAVRDHMDTPTRYGPAALAALLPTLSEDKAQAVIERLTHAAGGINTGEDQPPLELALGVAITHTPDKTTPEALLDGAARAVARHAAHPDEPVPVTRV